MEQESDRHFSLFVNMALLIGSTLTFIWLGLVGWGLIRVVRLWL